MKKIYSFVTCFLILLQVSVINIRVNAQSFTASIADTYDSPNHCEGFGVYLEATPFDNTLYTYTWSCPGGVCPNLWMQNGGSVSFFPSINQPLTELYSVLITEIATGDTASASVTINTYPNPFVSTPNQFGCEGQQIYVHTSGGSPAYGPYTYQWGYPGGTPSSSDSILLTFSSTISFGPDLQITNGFGCSALNSQTLKLFGSPTPVVSITAAGPVTFCAGGNVGLNAIVTHPSHNVTPATYQWKRSLVNLNNPSLTPEDYLASSSGRYRCVVTSTQGCTGTSNFIDVVAFPRPAVSVTPAGPVGICVGQPVTLVANAPTAVSYSWKKNSNISPIPNSNNDSLTVTQAGKYKVTVTDANNCTRTSAKVEVVGLPSNQVSASGPLSFCAGDSVVFTAAPGYFYQWRKNNVDISGALFQSYTATTPGNYKVKVTNSYGCTVTSPVQTVVVPCRIAGEIVNIIQVECYPNPFQSEFTIVLPDEWNEAVSVMLYDLSGRLVYQSETTSLDGREMKLSAEGLKNGTYLLQVMANGEQFKRVVVKN